MTTIQHFERSSLPSNEQRTDIISFLFEHLEEYGDPREDIEKAMNFALQSHASFGGFVSVLYLNNEIVAATIVNKTGMEGYIPENILVYIAAHSGHRGKGFGKQLMQHVLSSADGDVALHVEPNNPAIGLYSSLGFTNPYLEMRYTQNK